jgi:TRAP-type C4-dicarboxylate transport system substrate-binding protein
MGWVFNTAYEAMTKLPNVLGYSRIPYEVEVERGLYDWIREIHAETGLYFIGRGDNAPRFAMFLIILTEPVETPSELAGKKLSVEFTAREWLARDLKVTPVQIEEAERYTALERGLIDGFLNPLIEIYPFGFHEVAKYIIDEPFVGSNMVTIMNLDSWNRLPQHLQDLITQVQIDIQPVWAGMQTDLENEHRQLLLDAGVTFIKFSPEDAKWFVNSCFDTEWEVYMEKYPEIAPKMKEMVIP